MPPRKRARTTKGGPSQTQVTEAPKRRPNGARLTGRVVRGGIGSLKDFPEMPIDVLNEIFSYLSSQDLLSLAQTSKVLRRFLLDRSNVRIWRDAREALDDIPPLPPVLSEPAYVHLLFSPYCHGCGKAVVRKVIWIWFKRYCKKCLQEQSDHIRESTMHDFFHEDTLQEWLSRWTPDEVLNIINPYDGYHRSPKRNVYHIPQLRLFADQWNAAGSADGRTEIYERQVVMVAAREECAEFLEEWWEEQKQTRLDEVEAVRHQRYLDICERLIQEGWRTEVVRLRSRADDLDRFCRIPSVNRPAALSDKAYETVRRDVEGLLVETRDAIAIEERQGKLASKMELLEKAIETIYVRIPCNARMLCRPRSGDLVFEPEVKALLDTSTAEGATVDDFVSIVPVAGRRWEDTLQHKLGAIVRSHIDGIEDNVNPLDLAAASFSCPRCKALPLRYPEILTHTCLRSCDLWTQLGLTDQFALDLHDIAAVNQHVQPFNYAILSGSLILAAADLLDKLAMPPTTTTYEHLRIGNVRMRLIGRSHDPRVYAWNAALRYGILWMGSKFDGWRCATADELQAISQVASYSGTPSHYRQHGLRWVCASCPKYIDKWDKVTSHLLHQHKMSFDQGIKDGMVFVYPGDEDPAEGPWPIPGAYAIH
ncbi:hypothetical protein PYCCODRAFT_1234910 [Trametes coccinea BRFM310]|uniref:F-box domain-containing protein n=1 Tax=Trametes coccinea (strain BRFM310) TaxID=1353009 RepID=A0A1Y2IWC3_TRAC3|nr:hypothetical protein PYCCODRAFT_1234910 [Trametes coccinea BRFM310]